MPIDILMPALSPTMEEGALAKWNVKEGDTVKAGDVIAEIETDKATMEFEAVDEGVISKIIVPAGTSGVKVNTVIAVLVAAGESAATPTPAPKKPTASAEPPPSAAAPAPAPAPASSTQANGARLFATPLARRIAAEKGVDLAAIKGSGPHGRIVKADVEAAKPGAEPPASAPAESAAPVSATPSAAAAPAVSAELIRKIYADRAFVEVPLDGMRRTIAARLSEAKQTIPHFYLRRDIRLDALLAFREQANARSADKAGKLSVNDFIIKACALALRKVPACNAVWAGDRVLQFEAADVAVAVAIEGGLFTPVIRDAHAKTLSTISAEMRALAKRARERKLAPAEYQGGSFAISNLGMFGIDNFDAVINPPHGSILAVGAGVRKPVVAGEAIGVATIMSVTLSVDHRVIDGALGAQFLDAIRGFLEEPLSMVL